MKPSTLVYFSFVLFFKLSTCREKARFDFYRVYEVTIKNEDHLKLFQHFVDHPDGYTFMSNPPTFIGMTSQLIVPPHKFGEWSEIIENSKLDVKIVTKNLQNEIDNEEIGYQHRSTDYDWTVFRRYNETVVWMNELANKYDEVASFVLGHTFEGREIIGLRINVGNQVGKKSILFEGTIHSNEWISGTTVTFIINELLTTDDPGVKELLQIFDWWFVPTLNVDGFEYTWDVDRTWRKTRGTTRIPFCQGADPNRNWDVLWGSFGGSINPCSNNYYGDHVFSDVEVKQFADFIGQIPNLFGYLSFHSWGRLLMAPYAYKLAAHENLELLRDIGMKSINSIAEIRGTRYFFGRTSFFFGRIAGTSIDYVVLNQKPKIAYVYELSYSHILPNREIIRTGREIYASVITMFSEAVERGLV